MLSTCQAETSLADVGDQMYRLIADLYPICRSITGDGVRQTLKQLQPLIPLDIYEVASGTQVFDWTVPKEWNIKDAYIKNSRGERIIDFHKSNLHVMSYSVPVKMKLSLKELKEHIFTLPGHPDWVPYRTSYYKEHWGFCMTHEQLLEMDEGEYEVCIDSSLDDGYLTYGEYFLEGQSNEEVLISTHVCHPSLCNDNLSGISVAVHLARYLASSPRRYSYRFLFLPGLIGPITWLCRNEARLKRIRHGFVLSGVGDRGPSTYKRSRRGDAEIDRAFAHVLKHSGNAYNCIDFSPYGYDERQYCSPAFDLPVGVLMRTPHGEYPEYHTSADDLNCVSADALGDSFRRCVAAVDVIENNRRFLNLNPKCEPQLGKRGLYKSLGGQAEIASIQLALLWVLNMSDGRHSLLDIAERGNLPFETIKRAVEMLLRVNLLQEVLEDSFGRGSNEQHAPLTQTMPVPGESMKTFQPIS
jgi:aminopeptidase-like protein